MKQRFFSRLFRLSHTSLKRFPEVIVTSVIGSLAMLFFVEYEHAHSVQQQWVGNIVLTCVIGLSLLVGVKLLVERLQVAARIKLLLRAIPLLFLVGYYFSLPKEIEQMVVIRSLLLALAFHCFVAVAPYLRKGEANGFWQFNKTVFLQIILSVLYTAVLYLGIVLALLAIKNLFGVEIKDRRFFELWVLLVGIFNTWFFLSGLPNDYEQLEQDCSYPKGLKVFTQYVLLPLVSIYLLILYVYLIKIIALWKLPVGWVSVLILSFAIAGILSLLLVHPLRAEENESWLKHFTRWFYRLQFPLVGLLFVAIGKRLSQYGITEERYFILILAFWLLGISLYFLISRKKNIRFIPISLGALALLASFGPWGCFSVSKNNQLARLKHFLEKEQLLVDGKWVRSSKNIAFDKRKTICSVVDYLNDMHGSKSLQPLLSINLDTLFKKKAKYEHASALLDTMGVRYVDKWQQSEDRDNYVRLSNPTEASGVLELETYRYLVNFGNLYASGSEREQKASKFAVQGDTLYLWYPSDSCKLKLKYRSELSEVDLNPLLNKYKDAPGQQVKDSEEMVFHLKTKNSQIKFILYSLDVTLKEGEHKATINNLSGCCLLK